MAFGSGAAALSAWLEIAGFALPMKLKRLYQPRNPLFWIMLALNLLSLVLGWITHTRLPGVFFSLVIAVFAIGNAVLGAYLMWRLANS